MASAKYTCANCGKTYARKSAFDTHVAQCSPKSRTVTASIMMRPFLKWVGGKTQILEDVLSKFPPQIQDYYEPFLGGGSVLLGLLSKIRSNEIHVSGKIRASDLNADLISLYRNIQSNVEALLVELRILCGEYGACDSGGPVNRAATNREEALSSPESYYFWIRMRFNGLAAEVRSSALASAMFLFLNKTCFRGLYRVGPRGFNVPFGNYKSPSVFDEAHIREVSEWIRDVEFSVAPFEVAMGPAGAGDFAYLDPPYAPENEKSFVAYTADGFDLAANQRLFRVCREATEKRVRFALSNADVDLIREAFRGYRTLTLSCRRAIHSKEPDAKTNELLIWNDENL